MCATTFPFRKQLPITHCCLDCPRVPSELHYGECSLQGCFTLGVTTAVCSPGRVTWSCVLTCHDGSCCTLKFLRVAPLLLQPSSSLCTACLQHWAVQAPTLGWEICCTLIGLKNICKTILIKGIMYFGAGREDLGKEDVLFNLPGCLWGCWGGAEQVAVFRTTSVSAQMGSLALLVESLWVPEHLEGTGVRDKLQIDLNAKWWWCCHWGWELLLWARSKSGLGGE